VQIQEVFDRRRFVFLDGGMGTQLQQRGLQPGQKPELAALEMPDVLTAIHRDYTAAGADILLANTFGANAKKLAGCGRSVEEVVSASIACARRAGQETSALVALDIGPLGELLAPAGTLAFEDAYEEFAQVIRAGAVAGADLVFLETMTDLYELKAAILAAKENCTLPIFTSMSFESRGRTFTGCTVESYAVTAAGLGADAVGINCSLGPKEILPFAQRLCRLHIRHGTANNVAARVRQCANLRQSSLRVARVRVGHGLHRDGRAAANQYVPYLDLLCNFHSSNLSQMENGE